MGKIKKYSLIQRAALLALLFVCLVPLSSLAQTIQLTGTVTDTKGETLIGASVLEKGTTNGCITDIDGNFTLTVAPNATMVISYVGYVPQEIPLKGQKTLTVTLKDDTEMLDEVVVVGYGTMKKSDMTGAISSVKSEDLMKRATTSATEALQGKIAGVSVLKSGGNAGASISVKIRGIKTMGDNEPLYIIDGYPGDINTINPQDIESMEILKDGAAAAIYGSVAANGVVIVSTKNGKEGELKISFNTYMTVNSVAKKFDMLNADGYLKVHNMMYENAEKGKPGYLTYKNGQNPTGADTDWQDEMLRTGIAQNYYVNLIGGSEVAKYSLSYGHADEKGIFRGNSYIQDNARLKLNAHKYIFNFDAGLNFKVTQSKQPQYTLKEMYSISPLIPVYDENQTYGYGLTDMSVDGVKMEFPTNRNVMADDHYKDRKYTGYDITGNIGLTVKFAPWLTFKTSYTYNGYYYNDRYHRAKYEANAQEPSLYPYNYEYNSYYRNQTFENVLTFMKDFGKHSITAMVGNSIISAHQDKSSVSVEGKKTEYDVVNGGLTNNRIEINKINSDMISLEKQISDVAEGLKDVVTKSELADMMNSFVSDDDDKWLMFNAKFSSADEVYESIYKQAKSSIYVVDNYIGLRTLVHLKNSPTGVNIILFSDNVGNNKLHNIEFIDFCKEYPTVNLSMKKTGGIFHDRFIVLDYGTADERVFLCGASSKDAGARITSIVEDYGVSKYTPVIATLLKNPTLNLPQ